MFTMQAFYIMLCSNNDTHDQYWLPLARLTRVSLDQIAAFESDIVWSIWG